MIDPKLEQYQASGKFEFNSIFSLFGALIITTLLAILYAYLSAIISWPLSKPLFLLLVLWSAVKLINYVVISGKVRNSGVAFVLGLILGFCLVYVNWVSFVYFMSSKISAASLSQASNTLFTFQIFDLISFAQTHLVHNSADLFGWSPSPFFKVTCWVSEAILMVLIPGLFAFVTSNRRSFCENCQDWMAEEEPIIAFYYDEPARLKREFLLGSHGFMEEAKGIFNAPMHNYFVMRSEVCESCNDNFVVRLFEIEKESDLDKGRAKAFTDKMVATRPYYQHFSLIKAQFPVPEELVD